MTKAEKDAFVKRMAAARRKKSSSRTPKKRTTRASNPKRRTSSTRSKSTAVSRRKTTTAARRKPTRRRRSNQGTILGMTKPDMRNAAGAGLGVVATTAFAAPLANAIEDAIFVPLGIKPGAGQFIAYLLAGVATFTAGLAVSKSLFKTDIWKNAGNAGALILASPMFIRAAENTGIYGRPMGGNGNGGLPILTEQDIAAAETVAGRRRNPGYGEIQQFRGAGLPTLRGSFGSSRGHSMRGTVVPGRLAGSMNSRGMRGSIVAGRIPGAPMMRGSIVAGGLPGMRGSIVAGALPGQPAMRGRGGYGWY